MKPIILVFGLLRLYVSALPSSTLEIQNTLNNAIDFLWVDRRTKRLTRISDPLPGLALSRINSFEGHEFVVRLSPHRHEHDAYFTKGPGLEVLNVTFDDVSNSIILTPIDGYPTSTTLEATVATAANDTAVNEIVDRCVRRGAQDISLCITKGVYKSFKKVEDSERKLIQTSTLVSHHLRNYTCADPRMQTSLPIRSYKFPVFSENEFVYKDVNVLFETDRAKIWAVEDFLTEDECSILWENTHDKLEAATVVGEDGGYLSNSRKAKHAGYVSHLKKLEDDPLWDLQQRILKLVNYHAHYNLSHEGQEGFTAIHYGVGNQYMPHCDGACEGRSVGPGARIATAVLYCKEPELGGGTSFTKADVFVKPKRLAAAFFSYMGVDEIMDLGFTEHSGCPVIKGEKFIATFWMRAGVSSSNPYYLYNPDGTLFSGGK
eukprot:gene9274-10239_t